MNNINNNHSITTLKKYTTLFFVFCFLILLNFFNITYFNLIKFLQLFFKQDTILLIDCEEEKCELIDCYSMFEYLQEKGVKSYYIIYKTQPQFSQIYEKYRKNIIVINDPKSIHFSLFFKLLKTRYFLSSFGVKQKIFKIIT